MSGEIEKSEHGSSQEPVEFATKNRSVGSDSVEEAHVTTKTWIVVFVGSMELVDFSLPQVF